MDLTRCLPRTTWREDVAASVRRAERDADGGERNGSRWHACDGGSGRLRTRHGTDDVAPELVGADAGIREINHTYRAPVGDIDGDGSDDLIVVPHYGDFPRIYVNDGDGGFTDVAATSFPARSVEPRDRHGCPIGDVTGDGRADIFCTVGGGDGGTRPNPSELFVQRADGTFASWADTDFDLGPAADPFGRSRDAVLLDANGDEHADLYIQNAYPRADGRSPNSRLFINEDGERFVAAGRHGLAGVNVPVGGTNLQAIDYDGDGWDDILACGKRGVFLFRNLEGNGFRDVADRADGRLRCEWAELANVDGTDRPALVRLDREELSVHPVDEDGDFGAPIYRRDFKHGTAFASGDVNGDQRADIYVVRRGELDADKPDAMLINDGDGTGFEELAVPQLKRGHGDSVTAIDHNGDGRAGFVIMNGHRSARGPIELLTFPGG